MVTRILYETVAMNIVFGRRMVEDKALCLLHDEVHNSYMNIP